MTPSLFAGASWGVSGPTGGSLRFEASAHRPPIAVPIAPDTIVIRPNHVFALLSVSSEYCATRNFGAQNENAPSAAVYAT